MTNGTGRMHMDQLPNFVEHGFRCSALVPGIPVGPTSSPERRTLNPLFVEYLMGWPIGWTDCASAVTGFTRWQQDMRGLLSTLCLRPMPQQGLLL